MGLSYEDFSLGQKWDTQARTVTEGDVALFCGLSGDFNPLHSDEAYCKTTEWGGRIAHGPLGLAMAIGLMSQLNLINYTAIGLLNVNWDFKAPIMLGNTIRARVTVAGLRLTKAGKGIVTLRLEVINQNGVICQDGTMTLMMKTREMAA